MTCSYRAVASERAGGRGRDGGAFQRGLRIGGMADRQVVHVGERHIPELAEGDARLGRGRRAPIRSRLRLAMIWSACCRSAPSWATTYVFVLSRFWLRCQAAGASSATGSGRGGQGCCHLGQPGADVGGHGGHGPGSPAAVLMARVSLGDREAELAFDPCQDGVPSFRTHRVQRFRVAIGPADSGDGVLRGWWRAVLRFSRCPVTQLTCSLELVMAGSAPCPAGPLARPGRAAGGCRLPAGGPGGAGRSRRAGRRSGPGPEPGTR